jgi:Subtilase family
MRPQPRAVSVVVGVIDDGCALFNRKWTGASGRSRLLALWDQDQACEGLPWQPTAMGYGRQLLNDAGGNELDDALDVLRRDFEKHSADELQWYARLGYPRSLLGGLPERLHGTHVLDLAAGWPNPLAAFGSPQNLAGDAPIADSAIVFVSLPRLNTEDTTGGSLGLHVLDGLRYMIEMRKRLRRLDGKGGPPPLVVNLSYGTLAGPHDGSSLIEQAIDDLLDKEPDCAVVVGAGNGRERRCHAQIALDPGETRTLEWLRDPDDPTDAFAELWWQGTEGGVSDDVSLDVALTVPGQATGPMTPPGDAHEWMLQGQTLAAVLNRRRVPNGATGLALIAAAPTASRDGLPAAPAGVWAISVRNTGKATLHLDGWVERDDSPSRSRLTRKQSRWLDNPPGSVTEHGTLNSLATGRLPIVVGANYLRTGQASPYSALGPDRRHPPRRLGPDVMAAGDEHPDAPGLVAAGTRSGSLARMSGTSMAAPIVTRRAAAWLAQQAPGLTAQEVRSGVLSLFAPNSPA